MKRVIRHGRRLPVLRQAWLSRGLLGLGLLCLAAPTLADTDTDTDSGAHWLLERAELHDWLDGVAREQGLSRTWLEQQLAQAQHQPGIIEAMQRPAERVLEWADYRRLFITEQRIEEGRAFLQTHADTLQAAEAQYGVPATIITAIIGVETYYGRLKGRWAVLDALSTLAFDYPPRARFFRQELGEFLALANEEGWTVAEVLGSYAGAMGIPQFIASSYREYAIDFDADGRRDLHTSTADAIGSVGNYLQRHGWRSGEPIVEPWPEAAAQTDKLQSLWVEALEPAQDPAELQALGAPTSFDEPVRLLRLQGDGSTDWWVSYRNFYAITRYNHSELYAMAVYTLHRALRSERS